MTDQTKAPLLTTSEAADAVNRAKAMMSHASIPILARAMDDLDELYLAYERILTSAPSTPPSSAPETLTIEERTLLQDLARGCHSTGPEMVAIAKAIRICDVASHSPGTPAPAETPETRERDPLDELCEAIEKFGQAQFALGNSRPPTMLASLDQARIAQGALWRIITRILEAAASLIAERPPVAPTGIAADPDATEPARLSDNDAMLLVEIADAYRIASHWDAGAKAKRELLLRLALGEIAASPSIAATPDAPSKDTTARLLNIAEEIDLNEPWPEWRADRDYLRTLAARSVSQDAGK